MDTPKARIAISKLESAFTEPLRVRQPLSWVDHIPFVFWLLPILRPACYVELGTHSGNSYFAVCQAVRDADLGTLCHAVDTWRGDDQAGLYGDAVFLDVSTHNQEHYREFSTLHRSAFRDALGEFPDGSVDLLHIDGRHTYHDVKEDWETWRLKLTAQATVLFHDTNVYHNNFQVWRLWEDLASAHPSFTFMHGHGLGILSLASSPPPWLTALQEDPKFYKQFFSSQGERLRLKQENLSERYSQIFLDSGQGCSEANSIVSPVRPDATTLAVDLDLTISPGIKGLRVDPLNEACALRLDTWEFRDAQGQILPVEVTHNGVEREGILAFFSSDPILTSAVPQGAVAFSLRLAFEPHADAKLTRWVNEALAAAQGPDPGELARALQEIEHARELRQGMEAELHQLREQLAVLEGQLGQARVLRQGMEAELRQLRERLAALEGQLGQARENNRRLEAKLVEGYASLARVAKLLEERAGLPARAGSARDAGGSIPARMLRLFTGLPFPERARIEPGQPAPQADPLRRVTPLPAGFTRHVVVVVPIYNAAQAVRELLDSCAATYAEPCDLLSFLLIDDGSPSAEIKPLLEGHPFSARPDVTVLANPQNLGYTATVNRGLRFAPLTSDVVILNSDTLIHDKPFEILQDVAHRHQKVASVTPLTNRGTIACLENWPHGVDRVAGLAPEKVSRAVRDLAFLTPPVSAPTGVGFCMYMTREALNEVGVLDVERFGRGYGEENDWCQRAAGLGYSNLICTEAYVQHQENASFGEAKAALAKTNMERLLEVHPDYLRDVAAYMEQDPLRAIRERLLQELHSLSA